MFPLNSVRNWRADAICPYDLARIVFVGHDVYDVPKIFKPTNGVSQEPRPTHLNVIVSVGGHSMLPKNHIKIRGQMISAPTELNCNSCFALKEKP